MWIPVSPQGHVFKRLTRVLGARGHTCRDSIQSGCLPLWVTGQGLTGTEGPGSELTAQQGNNAGERGQERLGPA